MKKNGVLIVISGFSGAGKGTLMKKLVADYDNYALSISMTTRSPREGEQHGREYFFVTKEEFEDRIANDGMIEYATYCGNYYGTPKAYVEEQLKNGKDVILEIEVQGAHIVKEIYPEAVLMFVMPPSAKELYRRLTSRGTETPEKIAERMARAAEESEGIDTYDYIVINDKLEDCIAQINTIVDAAHNTPKNNEEFIDTIKAELKDLLKGELR
jgi:guanylate kinase